MINKIILFLIIVALNSCNYRNIKNPISEELNDSIVNDSNTENFNNFNKKSIFTIIDFSDSIFSFRDYTERSKVSVFITTYDNCFPCKILQKELVAKYEKSKSIDKINFFLMNCPQKDNESYSSRGYNIFKSVDKLTEIFPTTFIFSPTENEFSKIQGSKFEVICDNIDFLVQYCKD